MWPFNRRKKQESQPLVDKDAIALKIAKFYSDNVVAAIKEYRHQTGEGLKESKAAIDKARNVLWVRENTKESPMTIGDLIKEKMRNEGNEDS